MIAPGTQVRAYFGKMILALGKTLSRGFVVRLINFSMRTLVALESGPDGSAYRETLVHCNRSARLILVSGDCLASAARAPLMGSRSSELGRTI
jgi:hypothetical protein